MDNIQVWVQFPFQTTITTGLVNLWYHIYIISSPEPKWAFVIPWPLSSVVILLRWSSSKIKLGDLTFHSRWTPNFLVGWKLEIFENLLQIHWLEWNEIWIIKSFSVLLPKLCPLNLSTFQDGHYIVKVKQRYINNSGERQFEFRFSLQYENSVNNRC
jgi:hypothetical protein